MASTPMTSTMSFWEDAAKHVDDLLTSINPLATETTVIDDFGQTSPYSHDIVIILSVVIGAVVFTTVAGNLLVILAFCTTPKLRTYNNFFILGLAVADLVVGAVDMPLAAISIITGRWPLGVIACDVFTFLDHVFTHVSVLLVTLISLDRCVAVTHPIRHRHHWRRRSRAIAIVAVSYVIPVAIWLPTTALWQTIHGIVHRPIPDDLCEPLYIYHSVFTSVFAPVLFLFIPFTVTAILCVRIFIAIKGFHKNRKKMNSVFGNDSMTTHAPSRETPADDTGVYQGDKNARISTEQKERREKKDEIGKESVKGMRTLVFIVAAMAIAWFPGNSTTIVASICPTCVPDALFSVVLFWGYINSLMNPICYALADKTFKDAFIRILTLRCFKKDKAVSLGAANL